MPICINKVEYVIRKQHLLKSINMKKPLKEEQTKGWYKPNSGLWGERYYEEQSNILTPTRTKGELEIIKKYLKASYKTVLDAPCGYGRLSNPLSQMGFVVTGIDLDPFSVKKARDQAIKEGLEVTYDVKDLQDLNNKNEFDVVLNIYTSIGYLDTDDDNRSTILKLCDAVKEGGRLIFELINPLGILTNYLSSDEIITPKGLKIAYERAFDPTKFVNIERITYRYPNGQVFSGVNKIRLYLPHEIIIVCKEKGLKLIDLLSYDGTKYSVKTHRMWLIFEK